MTNKRLVNEAADGDYADALYNKSCYLALRFDRMGNEQDKRAAIETLSQSATTEGRPLDEHSGDPL
jgi:hypothetical protein